MVSSTSAVTSAAAIPSAMATPSAAAIPSAAATTTFIPSAMATTASLASATASTIAASLAADSAMEITYPVVETFYSIQGEGYWTGQSAFFIRLGGCDVCCTWCDTKHSWDASVHRRRSVMDLVIAATQVGSNRVIVTGGEPTLYDLRPLVAGLRGAGRSLHLETSGAHLLQGDFDWVTLSPKTWLPPHPSVYAQAHELKIVVSEPADLDWAEVQAAQVGPDTLRLLQPEWNSPEAMRLVYDYVLHHSDWRISLQTHKILRVR